MTEHTAIGKPTPLIDGRAKVTGTLRYTPDLSLPGMLHARLVVSPHAHARINQIDTQEALNVPGVVAVFTAHDLPEFAPTSRDRLLLARDRVIFVGQSVALVVATNEAAATDGADKVYVDYEPLPAFSSMEDALAPETPLVWPDGLPNVELKGNLIAEVPFDRGDVDAGFAQADIVMERTFVTPMVQQSPMETQAVLIQPDLVTGGATVWTNSQSQFDSRQNVANFLGVPESDVRAIVPPLGGGFGGKSGLHEGLIALVARKLERPVRLALTRMEELAATNPAPPLRIHLRLGAKRDGTLTAMQADLMADSGCYPDNMGNCASFAGWQMTVLYNVPNFHIDTSLVLSFKQSASSYRAPCAPTVVFAIDSLVDDIARELNLDPIEMRLKNVYHAGDSIGDYTVPTTGVTQVLEALRDHPAYQNQAKARAEGRGVGIALGAWIGGVEPAAAACGLHRDGKVHIHVGSVDLSGTTTSFALMAAEVFGVKPEDVKIITADTDNAPYSGVTGGSKVLFTTGAAVVQAAKEARQQALTIAAEEFEAAVEDLEIVDGEVRVKGVPDRKIKLSKIASKTMHFGGKYAPVYAHGRMVERQGAPAFSAQLAEVEVDHETGEVKVHKLVIVQDVGFAINPLVVQGQMTGGATQGIGWALHERMVYDESGQLLTGSFMDYNIPAITQSAAHVENILVEVPSDNGPFGIRGVGEPPVIPTAAAIANAVRDATGTRFTQLPITPPDVVAALNSH
jgi:CO/xanthine dehydrogenase Mo-binding subunit